MRHSFVTGLAALALTALGGCASTPPPNWPVSSPAELCNDSTLGPEDFCMPSARIERWLKAGHFMVNDAGEIDEGVTAPYKLRLEVPGGRFISAKFKRAPDELDAFNNSPRRELAAYETQKFFLDPKDYVVPPTALVCLPVAKVKGLMPELKPHGKSGCAIGVMAYWVEGLTDEDLIDDELWGESRAYRRSIGNLNALTVLIGHQDDLGMNFLRSSDPKRPRLLAVDNGLAFGAMGINPVQWFSSGWSDIRVTELPRRTVARLKRIDQAMLEKLEVVGQLEWRRGTLVPVPLTPAIDNSRGVRSRGPVIQLGLTAKEITDVHERLAELLGEVESGEVVEGVATVTH